MQQFFVGTQVGCRRLFPRHLRYRISTLAVHAVAIFLLQLLYQTSLKAASNDRPNIVLIMADDLGFSDLGCYGSEIDTPNLDALAQRGLRFNQFYNTAKCHSSRICLLTGLYMFQAGNTSMDKGVTIAEVLRSSGYKTLMTGKWHLDGEPTDRGFDRYFGHLSGSTNFFVGDETFRINGQPFQVPQQDFYTTDANTDLRLNSWMKPRKRINHFSCIWHTTRRTIHCMSKSRTFANTKLGTALAGTKSETGDSPRGHEAGSASEWNLGVV